MTRKVWLASGVAVAAILVAGNARAQATSTEEGASTDAAHSEIAPGLVVTAPYARDRLDLLGGVSVVTGEQLVRDLRPQIGDTLAAQPGVSATSFGPGASRPVLRGFQGERIRVLTDGIGSIDVSNTSADHAVTIDPITAERIEVLRGPASLLYGSSAIGGVVNVLDRRIPRNVPDEAVHVDAQATYGSAAEEVSIGSGVDVPVGSSLVAHVDGSWRDTNDLEIGGYLLSKPLRALAAEEATEGNAEAGELANARGRLPNSDVRTKTLGGGLALIREGGSLGFSVGWYDSNYGVPERPVLHEEEGEEGEGHEHGAVRLDIEQIRADLRGEVDLGGGFFEKLRTRVGWADYRHIELEGDEIGTRFDNQGAEGRLELVQANRDGWRGAVGGQFFVRDFSAVGEEAFLPKNETEQWGLFTLQELDLGALKLEASARFERTDVSSIEIGEARSFDALSGALGGTYEFAPDWRVGINGSRAVRAPSAEELFSNGPHVATQAYEVGDPNFKTERAWGLEGFIRAEKENYSLGLTLFGSWFDNFIYESATGEVEDELPVFQYAQADARYYGVEFEGSLTLFQTGDVSFVADAVADYVRATVSDVGPVPRIPPLRLLGGVEAQSDAVNGRVEVEWVDEQDRVADFEMPTNGYTVFNASVAWRPFGEAGSATLMLSANNIFDVDVRRHASFLKDFAPLAGRDVRVTLRTTF